MIRYLIKNAIRNIVKQLRFSIINTVGLVIGIVTFVIIVLWVNYESSFDNFNADSDLIYRVTTTTGAQTPNPMATSILEEVPEVESAVRYQITNKLTFKADDKLFYENKVAMADPKLFQMFNFPFVVSDAEHAMSQPFNVVLTQRIAEKYFGKEDPLGKTILVEGRLPVKVTGIIKNLPANSHMQFDCVVPYSVMEKLGFDLDNWYNWNPDTYIKLRQNKNVDAVNAKIQALADKYRNNNTEKFVLQPLKEIHFNTKLDFDHAVTINPGYIYILSGGAFLILIISIINYINLSVALYKKRLKEVGVKRTLGATKANLVKQIFVETAILVSVSFMVAMFIISLIKPMYLNFLDESASFKFFTPVSVIGFILLGITIAFISGLFPAWVMSSLKTVNILSKKTETPGIRFSSRQIPVIVQFTLSIILIIGAIGISNQLNFIRNADLGFNGDNIISIPLKSNSESKFNSLRAELAKDPNIEEVSVKDHSILGFENTNGTLSWEGKKPGEKIWVESNYVARNYFSTLGIDFAAGRDFSEESQSDSINKIIVNETLVNRIMLDDPVGKKIRFQGSNKEIIGVIKDARFQSLHKAIEPQVYQVINFKNHVEEGALAIVKYKSMINSGPLTPTIDHIKTAWETIYPELPFQSSFLSLEIENQYKSEKKLTLLMYIFSGMSIFLSCLGLLALSVFIIEKRTKEIGIRKVNGARVSEVITMLNKDLVIWVAAAFVIATPVAWLSMNKWLESFVYKTNLSWWIFALAGVLALGIALLTVSWQSWRAATRNPVEALRYE